MRNYPSYMKNKKPILLGIQIEIAISTASVLRGFNSDV
jgi:hypothetical protein